MRLLMTATTTTVLTLLLRRRMLNWGATAEERSGTYPGDDLLGRSCSRSTMATTLPGLPDAVWPWLVQMGVDRAGWYSWDRFDNAGRASATEIITQWQDLRIGDRIAATTDGRFYFTVASMEYPSTLVLRSDFALPSGRPLEPAEPDPRAFAHGVWGFHMWELPGGRTRLVVRTTGRDAPWPITAIVDALFAQPAHLIMQARQFRNLARLVRSAPGRDIARRPGQPPTGLRKTAYSGSSSRQI